MRKNTLIITVVILIVIGVVFGLYSWWEKEGSLAPASNPQQIINLNSPNIVTNFPDAETNNWKTYHSEKYGYEIKHQDNFEAKEYLSPNQAPSDTCDSFRSYDKKFTQKGLELQTNEGIKDVILSFTIYINPTPKCEESFLVRHSEISGTELPSEYLSSEKIVVDDNTFIKKTYLGYRIESDYETSEYLPYKFSIWYLTLSEKTYVFFYSHRLTDESFELESEFKKILSTFKIIN